MAKGIIWPDTGKKLGRGGLKNKKTPRITHKHKHKKKINVALLLSYQY